MKSEMGGTGIALNIHNLGVNATLRPLYPRERDPVPIVQEVGWASVPVWTGAQNLLPARI